jgi:hypothetical protein
MVVLWATLIVGAQRLERIAEYRLLLDDDRMAATAIDAPHSVKQKNQKSPQGNKLKTPLGELIVSGGGLMAARTDGLGALCADVRRFQCSCDRSGSGPAGKRIPENGGTDLRL